MSTPNTTALTYNGYVTQIATMAIVGTTIVNNVVQGVDPAFNALIPQMLNYSELRIQRDLDLYPSLTSNSSYSLTNNNNMLQISVNDFVVVDTISYVSGTSKTPLLPSSKEYIQNVYNDSSYVARPIYYAPYGGDASTFGNTYQNFIVGPYPDQSYQLLITGTVRLPTLYQYATTFEAGFSTTFISTYLPDLLIQASMIYISQFQRNFGPASNDPSMGPTYEAQYQTLLKGAMTEEYRKKLQASAWSAASQPVVATANR